MIRHGYEVARAFSDCHYCSGCEEPELRCILSVLSDAMTLADIDINVIGLKRLDDGWFSIDVSESCTITFIWDEPDAFNIRHKYR
jgi:hypothetical protein